MFETFVRAAVATFLLCGSVALAASADDSADSQAAPIVSERVAVLNFANRGQGDAQWDWLGKGLSDLTIGDLASQKFRVVSREQMQEMLDELAIKRAQTDPEAALKVLKVTQYVQGSYLIDKDRLELNASIIEADTGEEIHRAAVSGEVTALLDLQKRLAAELADVLSGAEPGTLDVAKLPRWTESIDASRLVYEGIDHFDHGQFLTAWGYFRRALHQDSKYADARYWAGRMMYYVQEYHQATIDLESFAMQYPAHTRVGDAVKELVDAAQQKAENSQQVLDAIDLTSRLAPDAVVHNQFGTGYPSTVGVYAAGLASQILRAEGKYRDAFDRWEKSIARFEPEHPLYWVCWHEMFALACVQLRASGELFPLPTLPRPPNEDKFWPNKERLHPRMNLTYSGEFEAPLAGGDEPIWRKFIKFAPGDEVVEMDFTSDPIGAELGFGITTTRYFYAVPGCRLDELAMEVHYEIKRNAEDQPQFELTAALEGDVLMRLPVDGSGIHRVTVPAKGECHALALKLRFSGMKVTLWKVKAKLEEEQDTGTLVLESRGQRPARGLLDGSTIEIAPGATQYSLPAGQHILRLGNSPHAYEHEQVFEIKAAAKTELEIAPTDTAEAQIMNSHYESFRYGASLGDWSGHFSGDISAMQDDRGRFAVLYATGRDIYVAESSDRQHWSPTRKLPVPINSAHDERQPILMHDGQRYVLAFQSDRNVRRSHATYVCWSEDLVNFSAPVMVDPAVAKPRHLLQRSDGTYLLYVYVPGQGAHLTPSSRGSGTNSKWLVYTSSDLIHWTAGQEVLHRIRASYGMTAAEHASIAQHRGRFFAWSWFNIHRKEPGCVLYYQSSDDGINFSAAKEKHLDRGDPLGIYMSVVNDELLLGVDWGTMRIFRCGPDEALEEIGVSRGSWTHAPLFDKERIVSFWLERPYLPHEHSHNRMFLEKVWPTNDWVLCGQSICRFDFALQPPDTTPKPNRMPRPEHTREVPPRNRTGAKTPDGEGVGADLSASEVHVVGVYEGTVATEVRGVGEHPGVVTVNVAKRSKPIILVVTSYEPVIWKIEAPKDAIAKVIASGYHAQIVEGVEDVPVTLISWDDGDERFFYAYRQVGEPTENDYERAQIKQRYDQLVERVKELTKQEIKSFQGQYKGSTFEIK